MNITTASKVAFIIPVTAILLIIGMLTYATIRMAASETRKKTVSQIVKVVTQRRIVSEKALLTGRPELAIEGQTLHETLVDLLLTKEFPMAEAEAILQEMRLNNVRSQQVFTRLLALKELPTWPRGSEVRVSEDPNGLVERYFALSDAIVDGAYRLEHINRMDARTVLQLNWTSIVVSSLVLLILVVALFIWINRHLIVRLTALASQLRRLGENNFEERANGFGNDEIGQLAADFNDMADRIQQSQDRLRALAAELNLAEQRERKRLACELHDHLQQMLVLGKLKLGQGKRLAEAAPRSLSLMEETDELLSQALQYTRTLVSELSPPVLREHGMAAALRWLAEYMKRHDLEVTVVAPQQDVELPEDHALQIFQAVRELLMNARKYAGTGQAEVRMATDGGMIKIEVRDSGKGFDIESTTARATAGPGATGWLSSGFGLLSIQERMKALGGRFTIQSSPGAGTVATLLLPIQAAHLHMGAMSVAKRDVPSPTNRTLPIANRIRVLLVDDHSMIRQGLRAVLESYPDIELVGEASNGEEAITAMDQLRPTVVIMDINMPKMNGIDATQRIKAQWPDTQIIGLSVNADGENRDRMISAGAANLLTKEAVVDQLYQAIHSSMRVA